MTANRNPHLSFLQRPCVAIFLQTFWFNSELNSGIPKHNSRGTQSASAAATTKGYTKLLIHEVYMINNFVYYDWPGFNWSVWSLVRDPEIFIDSSCFHWHPRGFSRGEDSEGCQWISETGNKVFWVCTCFWEEGTQLSSDTQSGFLHQKKKI